MRSGANSNIFRGTSFVGFLALAVSVGVASGDSNLVKATATGKARVSCTCILSTSGCALRRFDEFAGKQRRTWTQDANVIQGKQYDASLLCYRKRDVFAHGEGLCCELNHDERDVRFFLGTIQSINE